MNAIELEEIISSKLDGIAETIAFFYERENKKKVINDVLNLPFYIFNNDASQHERLKYIDLYDIAKEFAKDITLELDIDEETREVLEKKLSVIIKDCYDIEDIELSKYLKKVLSNIEYLNNDIESNITKLITVIRYYKDDYKIKEIKQILASKRSSFDTFRKSVIFSKNSSLRSTLKIYLRDDNLIEEIWELLYAFNPDLYEIADDRERVVIVQQQMEFYHKLGYNGQTLSELLSDVKKKKGTIINAENYKKCMRSYELYFNEDLEHFIGKSSLPRIIQDTKDKKYAYDVDLLIVQLFEPWLEGINIAYMDEQKNIGSFIVYNNDGGMYSKSSTDNIIHEIIHYLGGINAKYQKRGLSFYNKQEYNYLEEAFVNYLSDVISKKYRKKYGDIIEVRIDDEIVHFLECTKPYMKEVFNLYEKELLNIHIGSMSLKEANSLCPIEQISKAITRIYQANEKEQSKVIKEEIAKLTRGNKR